MSVPDRRDDDAIDELPPMGSLDDEEELGVDDATLGADEDVDLTGAEDVGLDDAAAGAEVFDVLELLGAATGDEDERWTAETEAAGELVEDDGLADPGEEVEHGWTADSEAAGIEGWDEDVVDRLDEGSILGDDAGEEGVDEVFAVRGGEDDFELPPLDEGEEGDAPADDIDLQEEAEIEGVELSYEEEARMSGATLPGPLEPARLDVSYLGPDDDALAAVACAGPALYAGGEALYLQVGARLEPAVAEGLEGQDLTSLALDPRDPRRLVVGTRLGGAFRSTDGGASFHEVNAWLHHQDASRLSVAFFVRAEPHDTGVRLWGRTRAGALYRSDDLGDSWSSPLLPAPVLGLAVAPGEGTVALCVPRAGAARIAVSPDGGHRWTMREVEGLEGAPHIPDADHHVAALGEAIVVVREGEAEGPFLSRDGGVRWERLGRLPAAGPVALAREGGRTVLYAALFFDGADRGVVVREPVDAPGEAALLLDVRAERDARRIEGRGDPEGDNRVLALEASAGGGRTHLDVATGAGLFRVDVSHE